MARCTSGNWPIFAASKEADFDELQLGGWEETTGLMPNHSDGAHHCIQGHHWGHEDDCEEGLDLEGCDWIKIDQKPGDGYMMSGILNWHYREKNPYGIADVLLFHFVPRD